MRRLPDDTTVAVAMRCCHGPCKFSPGRSRALEYEAAQAERAGIAESIRHMNNVMKE